MRASDRSGLAVMLSVALAAITLRPLTQDGSYVILSWLLIAPIGGTNIVLRRPQVGGGCWPTRCWSAAVLARPRPGQPRQRRPLVRLQRRAVGRRDRAHAHPGIPMDPTTASG
jgi:hypothetical protein